MDNLLWFLAGMLIILLIIVIVFSVIVWISLGNMVKMSEEQNEL